MRTCDELGVCAGRTPRCKGCEPVLAGVFQGLLGNQGDAIRIMKGVARDVEFDPAQKTKNPRIISPGVLLVNPTQLGNRP